MLAVYFELNEVTSLTPGTCSQDFQRCTVQVAGTSIVIVGSTEPKDSNAQLLDELQRQLQQGLNQHVTLVVWVGGFCPLEPFSVAASSPGVDKGETVTLQREQWFGDAVARVLVTRQTFSAGSHG